MIVDCRDYIFGFAMMECWQVQQIVNNLESVLHIEGAIVDMGCNIGTATLHMKMLLDEHKCTKQIHAYDSFQGLPPKRQEDINTLPRNFELQRGKFVTTVEDLKNTFIGTGYLPVIHEGWFNTQKYPDKIAFALFDGNFYSSIMDSFDAVYDSMSSGGIIFVDDYGLPWMPGVKAAVDEFMSDKPEQVEELSYRYTNSAAIIRKL